MRRADLSTFRQYVADKERFLGPLAGAPSSRVAAPASEGNVFYLDLARAPRHPYRVRLGCGHVVIRRMREHAAGVRWAESVVLEMPGEDVVTSCFGCATGAPRS